MFIVLAFAGVVFLGAPYLPTLRQQGEAALDLLELQPGQTLLELGCGDGKILIAAAERGWQAVGIEINPILALVAWARTRRFGGRVRVRLGNFWHMRWPKSDGIFVFLVPHFMGDLDAKMRDYGGRLVSVAFTVPDTAAIRTKNGVYLYDYKKTD